MEEKMKVARGLMGMLDIIQKTCCQWFVFNVAWMAVEIILYGETRPGMADSLIGFAILCIMLKANYVKSRWQMAERELRDASKSEACGTDSERAL